MLPVPRLSLCFLSPENASQGLPVQLTVVADWRFIGFVIKRSGFSCAREVAASVLGEEGPNPMSTHHYRLTLSLAFFLVQLSFPTAGALGQASQTTPNQIPVATQWLMDAAGPKQRGAIKSVHLLVCPNTNRKGTAFFNKAVALRGELRTEKLGSIRVSHLDHWQ